MKKILRQSIIFVLLITMLISQLVYAAPGITLTDIKGNWAEVEIQKLFTKGIITGNEKGKYEPAKSTTRAEFTALLTRAVGLKGITGNSFSDPDYSKYWAKPYIEIAVKEGIIVPSEIGENFFGNVPLKRSEMAVMMARALKLSPSDSKEQPYVDITEPNGYIMKLYEEYLMRGTIENGKLLFKSNSQATKAEAATVVSRILDYKAGPAVFIAKSKASDEAKQKAADAAVELQRKADAAGVSVELFNKPVNGGGTLDAAHKEAIKQLSYYIPDTDRKNTAEESVQYFTQIGRNYILADWNIDYNTVSSTYADKVKSLVPYDWFLNDDVQRTIDYYVSNKALQEATFNTSEDLLYYSDGRFFLRGTVQYVWKEPTSSNIIKSIGPRDNGNFLKLGQWYEENIEIEIAGSGDKEPPHTKYRVFRVKSISDVRPIKR